MTKTAYANFTRPVPGPWGGMRGSIATVGALPVNHGFAGGDGDGRPGGGHC